METSVASSTKLTKSGILRLITVVCSLIAAAAIFFVAAGTLDMPRAWIYYMAILVYMVIATILMFVAFPGAAELINERGKGIKKDVKRWDRFFGITYTLLLIALPAVAGIDVGRFRSVDVPVSYFTPALVITILAYIFVHWAMLTNKYAETFVRVQTDRGHQVVSTGPYRFVRHPFYVSMIATNLLYPLAVGSLYAYVPALLIAGLVVWRTGREDTTLQKELEGYSDYAARVRYRLLPGVW